MRTFFHPDFTVGTGISPVQRVFALADCITAGGDLHPALRVDVLLMRGALLSRAVALFPAISRRLRACAEAGLILHRKKAKGCSVIFRWPWGLQYDSLTTTSMLMTSEYDKDI